MEYADKVLIRDLVIEAARYYGKYLAGHSFLYVYGNNYFELSFPVDRFKHLTGVNSVLPSKKFYQYSKKGSLTIKQIYFDLRYFYKTAERKLPYLKRITELTTNKVIILKGLKTESVVFKLSLTNTLFTLGLVEKKDINGNAFKNSYVPMSLRVDDKVIDKSKESIYVDFIFSKDDSIGIYDTLLFACKNKIIPNSIKSLIDSMFYK